MRWTIPENTAHRVELIYEGILPALPGHIPARMRWLIQHEKLVASASGQPMFLSFALAGILPISKSIKNSQVDAFPASPTKCCPKLVAASATA